MDSDTKIIELLKLLYDEWKYRQNSLWKRMIQFTIIIFFVSTLPITIGGFPGIALPNLPRAIFPSVGILLSVFFVMFCLAESTRIKSVDSTIKTIEGDIFPERYQKTGLISLFYNRKKAGRFFTARMAIWVPFSLGAFQILIAIVVLSVILTGNLS